MGNFSNFGTLQTWGKWKHGENHTDNLPIYCIAALPQHKGKSLIQLRIEDYKIIK